MGSKHSDETRLKMSNQRKGRKFTEQHKTLISEATKGKNNPNFGKKHSKETKALISLSRLGKSFLSEEVKNRLSKDSGTAVKVITLTTNETTVYNSLRQTAEALSTDLKSLRYNENIQKERGINVPFKKQYVVKIKRETF